MDVVEQSFRFDVAHCLISLHIHVKHYVERLCHVHCINVNALVILVIVAIARWSHIKLVGVVNQKLIKFVMLHKLWMNMVNNVFHVMMFVVVFLVAVIIIVKSCATLDHVVNVLYCQLAFNYAHVANHLVNRGIVNLVVILCLHANLSVVASWSAVDTNAIDHVMKAYVANVNSW